MPDIQTSKKSTAAALTREGMRRLALTDLYALTKNILYKDATIPMSDAFHKPVCRVVHTTPYADNLYLLARDHYKTGLITISRRIQKILKDPETRCLIVTNKAENAEKILSELTGHLFTNELLMWLFPEILHTDPKKYERNTRSDVTVKRKKRQKESTVTAIGVDGDITGQHFDDGSFDDIVSKENSQTRTARMEVVQWIRAARSLFVPGATRDYVGTTWSYDDAWMWLIEQKFKAGLKINIYRQPCWVVQWRQQPGEYLVDERLRRLPDQFLTDAQGHFIPVFPERFTYDSLAEIRRLQGDSFFAAQYLLDPLDAETTVFHRSKAIIKPRDLLPRPENLWKVMAVDPAISQKGWSDYSALAVVGFDHDNRAYVLDLQRGKWTVDELTDRVHRSFTRTPGITAIGFEATGFQKLYAREFTRLGEIRGQYLPITKLERDTQRTKETRIRGIEPFWNHGEIVFAADLPALDDFLEEAERFRLGTESTHDDMLDALADCLQLRVRPAAPDPLGDRLAHLDPEEQDRTRFALRAQEARAQQGAGPLDERSLKASWDIERFFQRQQQASIVAGVGEAW